MTSSASSYPNIDDVIILDVAVSIQPDDSFEMMRNLILTKYLGATARGPDLTFEWGDCGLLAPS